MQRMIGKLISSVACVTMVVFCCGCGGGAVKDEFQRFRVSGKVTFKGEPIPAGTIYFEPDAAKGNKGSIGMATISNGSFDTSSVKGTVGGAHFVRIEGYDGKTTPEKPQGSRLFNAHRIEIELPKQDSDQKFEVPASAAENMQPDGPPV